MKTIFREEEVTNKVYDNMMDGLVPSRIPEGEIGLTFEGKIAVKRKNGDYVVYNPETKIIQNQMNCVIKSTAINKMMMLMPTTSVKTGDVIKEKDSYYYVLVGNGDEVAANAKIKVVNLSTGNINNLNQEENILTGAKAYKKVVSLMENMQNNGNMSNLLPLMLMEEGAGDSSFTKMMLMSQMMGGNFGMNTNMFGNLNPMMFALLGEDHDLLPLMMMGNLTNNVANTTTNTATNE